VVRAIATGCTGLGGECANDMAPTDATAHVQALFALVPALRSSPAAPLTARGSVDADGAAFGAYNGDAASGGLAIHAGGAVHAASARLSTPAGADQGAAVVLGDVGLAGVVPARFFASLFGLDPAAWARLPGVRHVHCAGDCTSALQAAAALDRGAALVHADGDLELQGPAQLGSAQAPVVVVASGAVRVQGAVALSGVLYGASLEWNATPVAGALVRGAAISEGDYRGDGTPALVYDAAVLARLRGEAGSFVRLPGSWKDF
jgi:hypothetical protein